MSPMSDQPLTRGVLAEVLVEFHRTIIVPDIQRIVGESESRLRDQMQNVHDDLLQRMDKLETEYESLKAGLGRVEERVGLMDQRLETLETQYRDLRASVIRLEEQLSRVEERLNRVEERLNRVEDRLGRVESQVDVLVAATENDPLRAEVADLRRRVDTLQAQVRSLEKRFDQ